MAVRWIDGPGPCESNAGARYRSGPGVLVAAVGAGTLVCLLLIAAVMLAWRRATGALADPLPASAFWLLGAMLAATDLLVRRLGRRTASGYFGGAGDPYAALHFGSAAETRWSSKRDSAWYASPLLLLEVVVTIAIVGIGLSLSIPGSGFLGLAGFWGVLLVENTIAWRDSLRLRKLGPDPLGMEPPERTAALDPGSGDDDAQHVVQRQTRYIDDQGHDTMTGELVAHFEPSQRTASMHVAFCPPFATVPEWSCEVESIESDGSEEPEDDLRVRTVQCQPFGARVDLDRGPADVGAVRVVLGFVAQASGDAVSDGEGRDGEQE